jgi:hypothetical protein
LASDKGPEAFTKSSDDKGLDLLLRAVRNDQTNILTMLRLVLDALDSQTKLLTELASLGKDDPGPSPLADTVEKLTEVTQTMHGTLKAVAQGLDDLPERVRAALEKPPELAKG